MNGQEYLDLLKMRYSVRSFSDVQLTDAELDVLLQAAQLSPTAGLGYETGDFGDIDTSIVLTNIANAAAAENLGSCWVGAYDSAIIRKNFNIPNNYVLVDLMMVGHSVEDAEPSPRHEQTEPLDTLVVRETF